MPHQGWITLFGGGKILRLCFVSRVEQSKGLDTLEKISRLLGEEGLDKYVQLDFYGQKTDNYFDTQLRAIEMFEYKGVLQPDEVIGTLKRYNALIFPSHYEGEGCPGILVEALSASLPIIASDWKYNNEFVSDGDNGFLCGTFDAIAYVDAIKVLLTNKTLRSRMACRAHDRSRDYSVSKARALVKGYLHLD